MSTQRVAITSTQTSGCSIELKLASGYTVPSGVEENSVQSFGCWDRESDYMFIWTRPSGTLRRMVVPDQYIAWILAEQPSGYTGDFFRIEEECDVVITEE